MELKQRSSERFAGTSAQGLLLLIPRNRYHVTCLTAAKPRTRDRLHNIMDILQLFPRFCTQRRAATSLRFLQIVGWRSDSPIPGYIGES